MKKIILLLTISFFAWQGQAQSIERQVIGSYGLLTPTSSATAGEVVIETKTVSGSFTLNQGFQQNEEEEQTAIQNLEVLVEYSLFPNPTTDNITLTLEMNDAASVAMYLINAMGQQISPKTEVEVDGYYQNTWNTVDLTSGVYFLVVEDENLNQLETIQFLKK